MLKVLAPRLSEVLDSLHRLTLVGEIGLFWLYKYIKLLFLYHSSLLSAGHLLRRPTASDPLENGTVLDQGSSFTYQDVLAGLVGYLPGDIYMAVDEFRFSLTDGLHVDTGRMEIYIDLPASSTPRLAINRGLQLSAGALARFSVTMTHTDEKTVSKEAYFFGFMVSRVLIHSWLAPVFSVVKIKKDYYGRNRKSWS